MRLLGPQNHGNPRRVSIFLAEKGIEIPWFPVDMANGEHKSAEFLRKNPSGKVPVLELDDGTYLSETIAICRYLESIYPDPPMFGVGIRDQVEVEMWQRKVEIEIFINTSHYIRHTSPQLARMEPVQVPDWGNLCRARVETGLHMVDRQLADHEYLTGSRFTVADITLVLQLLGMPASLGVKVPDDCPNLVRWLEQVYRRPSVRETQPPGTGLVQDVVSEGASFG
jgi:glutathione S-transferase